MSLALLTHGYICPPSATVPGGAQVGTPPTITGVVEVVPVIQHGREIAPPVILGVEDNE